MSPHTAYQSDLFQSIPENSGYLAICISESRCEIAICSSSFVLCFLEEYHKPEGQDQFSFLQELFSSKQSLFARHFQEVNIGILHQDFCFLPSEMQFSGEEVLSLLTNTEHTQVFHGNTPIQDVKLVFSVSDNLVNLFGQSFETYRVVHGSSFAVNQLHALRNIDGLLILEDAYFDLLINKDQKLYSINRHAFASPEDITYFTLLALKDAGVEVNQAKLVITGKTDDNDKYHQNVREFVLETKVKNLQGEITIRSDFDLPKHYYPYSLNLLHANY